MEFSYLLTGKASLHSTLPSLAVCQSTARGSNQLGGISSDSQKMKNVMDYFHHRPSCLLLIVVCQSLSLPQYFNMITRINKYENNVMRCAFKSEEFQNVESALSAL